MKVLKSAEGKHEFIPQIVNFISFFNNINASAKHIQNLMKQLVKPQGRLLNKSRDEYRNFLTQILLSSIAQDPIRDFYYFTGDEKSYIMLMTPIDFGGRGICWTGYLRLEKNGLDKKQCVFCFIKQKEKKTKACELWIENKKLIYSLIYVQKATIRKVLPVGELQADRWYHLVLSHENKELILYLDGSPCIIELPTDSLPKKYDWGIIGASKNIITNETSGFFMGEMTIQYFYKPNPLFREVIRDLALKCKSLGSIYKEGAVLYDHNTIVARMNKKPEEIKFRTKEFINTTLFILDPKVTLEE